MNAHLPMLLCLAVLATLLAAALWHDLRTRRIPNRLVLWGTLAGLILNSFVPSGAGLFDAAFGGLECCRRWPAPLPDWPCCCPCICCAPWAPATSS